MKTLVYTISCLLLLGCQAQEWPDLEEDVSTACNLDRATDLPWLQAMIKKSDNIEGGCEVFRVDQGSYQGKTVFIPYMTGALCCICGNVVYDCQGEVVFSCEPDKEKKIKRKKTIWKHS
jgi:hypothetical protein